LFLCSVGLGGWALTLGSWTIRHTIAVAFLGWLMGAASGGLLAQSGLTIEELHEKFLNPPEDARILMRWWWFGPAATKTEITRELEQMKAAGIGGVEIANLYPLALDDPTSGFHNTPFLSQEHLEALGFAGQEARRLGLRVDVTLGSGWPFGGLHIPVTEAAGKLRIESVEVGSGASAAQAPFIDEGEMLLAAFLVPGDGAGANVRGVPMAEAPVAGWYHFPAAGEARTLLCFLSSRTGMVVKRPSVGANGFVLDHYDPAATETHLHAVGDKLMAAFGEHPPYAVFSDSLEDYASDWSPKLLDEFERRRGYDLRPHLLELVEGNGDANAAAVRHDWGRTLTEMANDGFLKPLEEWAKSHHTLLRSQTYGFPPVSLSSNRLTDLPEGEGKATFEMWREFSDTRWAASAGHLFHRPVISSETWTWLHSPAFRATPLDMKAEADLHFLQGINQLVGHGWPYSPEMAGEPGCRMYAAAALNAHNPWYAAMPELARYLQRTSFALRLGQPVNDVALLLPNDDVWATFTAAIRKRATPTSVLGFDESGSNVSLDERMGKALGDKVIAEILDAGYGLDFMDADAIDSLGVPYRVLVLPHIDRLPVATYEKVLEFARQGGVVIATGKTPGTAPGLVDADRDSARLQELSRELFGGGIASAHRVEDESQLGAALAKFSRPDVVLTPRTPEIGFMHRRLPGGELYFMANTSNERRRVRAEFRDHAGRAEIWNAMSGRVEGVGDGATLDLDLEAYGSRLIFFSNEVTAAPVVGTGPDSKETAIADLSRQWKVTFGGTGLERTMDRLTSWSGDARTRFFSGVATYEKTFDVDAKGLPGASDARRLWLDFGDGTKVPLPSPPGEHNMRAYLESPVREAAQVFVNGKLAGVVWHPPYRVEVTGLVRAGSNQLRLEVGNTAINGLAGQALPDYRLLWDRYGKLFEPQDMQHLEPLPSGVLGPVRLVEDGVKH
jgi:hypothetical protein